ncbi:MAG TPA: response regulator transcription factor [Longimicrobiales bacterium]|nr:response regulator transcription factor [Longimicrobiales bacterium]
MSMPTPPLEPSAVTGAEAAAGAMSATILVIDDEPQIRRAVRHALEEDAGRVLEAASGREGIDLAAAQRPGLIILDLGLPDTPGASVCREIRKWSDAPIIVLSARHGDAEKVSLLDAGADDYVTKPFSPTELRARVRAQLRRARLSASPAGEGPLRIGELTIDLARPGISRGGRPIHLTRTEWELLRALLRGAGRTLTHRQLFQAVWPRSSGDPQEYLRVYVRNLRRKLEADPLRPRLIVTEPGVGYRFESGG